MYVLFVTDYDYNAFEIGQRAAMCHVALSDCSSPVRPLSHVSIISSLRKARESVYASRFHIVSVVIRLGLCKFSVQLSLRLVDQYQVIQWSLT